MPSSDVTTRKSGSDFDCWIISFMHNYCIIMLNFSVSFRHGGCFDFTLRMKSRMENVKENVLVNMPTVCEKQISKHSSLVASRSCELDRDPQSLLFLHWSGYHSRSVLCGWYWVPTEIEADTFRVGHNPRWSTGNPSNGMPHKGLYGITVIQNVDPSFGRITRNKLK